MMGAIKKPRLHKDPITSRTFFNTYFTCTPIDMDVQMHMNNSCYLRVAELARWRAFAPSGIMKHALAKGVLFLAVEQVSPTSTSTSTLFPNPNPNPNPKRRCSTKDPSHLCRGIGLN